MTEKAQTMTGKNVFVAGGSSGINLGIARHFAQQGARVCLFSRSPDKLDKAVEGIATSGGKAIAIAGDVREYDCVAGAFASTVDQLGPIDVVISGAAGNFLSPALGLSANAFKTVVDIDLIGTFNVLRASFKHLNKPGASLISISAPQGVQPQVFQSHACAAKAGINMLTKCLAMEWGPAGVRVNAISPGPIADTEGVRRIAEGEAGALAGWQARLAMRRLGTVDDIAQLAEFLSSPAADYITGTIIDCDGGSVLGDAQADALSVRPRE